MAKWLIHGDPHLKISNLLGAKEFFGWIQSTADEHKVFGIINLGDLFDTHGVVRAEILGEYRNFLNNRGNLHYIHILGNHEMFTPRDATYHALQPFIDRSDDKYHVVDQPMELYNMGFVPYLTDASLFPDMKNEVVFAHQTFLGADFGNFRPEEGVDPDKLKAEIVYSGHIHMRQNVGKVRYVGSPVAQGVNDTDQTKGIVIFDDETLREQFIPSPFPMYRSLTVDLASTKPLESLIVQLNKDDNWIVDIQGPKLEIASFLSSPGVMALKKKVKIRFRSKPTDTGKERVSIKAVSVPDMIAEYIDRVYDGQLDKTILKSEMAKMLHGE